MVLDLQFRIKNNPNLYRYLRENSHWYKELNRNPLSLKELELEMKSKYKLTTKDRIENISRSIEMVRTFIDILN